MKHYESTALIEASPATIWGILVDTAHYQDWDSGVVRVEGEARLGSKITVVSSANPNRAFPVTVAELEPERRMVWQGGMPLGLFKGVRTYTLTPEGNATRFRMREEYSGPMLPLIWRSMPDLAPSFEQFARGLKAKAEATR
ncbi:MAG: SRPBCC family protein [Dehalococcoidia bacterium]